LLKNWRTAGINPPVRNRVNANCQSAGGCDKMRVSQKSAGTACKAVLF
jgi:hypothetical protein